MKEISTVIRVHHIALNEDYVFLADKFDFEPTMSDSDAGTLHDCSLTKTIEKPTVIEARRFTQPQNCIISFIDSSGKVFNVGTVDIPARVSINPYLSAAKILIDCRQPQSPYINV